MLSAGREGGSFTPSGACTCRTSAAGGSVVEGVPARCVSALPSPGAESEASLALASVALPDAESGADLGADACASAARLVATSTDASSAAAGCLASPGGARFTTSPFATLLLTASGSTTSRPRGIPPVDAIEGAPAEPPRSFSSIPNQAKLVTTRRRAKMLIRPHSTVAVPRSRVALRGCSIAMRLRRKFTRVRVLLEGLQKQRGTRAKCSNVYVFRGGDRVGNLAGTGCRRVRTLQHMYLCGRQ